MNKEAVSETLSILGFNESSQTISSIEDGATSLLRSDSGLNVAVLRRGDKYDTLVVGTETECPVPSLRAILETAVLPLSDTYAAHVGVAHPERDSLRKRIREASVALDVIAKGRLFSVTPPELPLHRGIEQLVESGATSADDLPESLVDDLAVLNQLQANVVAWSKEINRIVQISRVGPGAILTAEEETVFWSSLDSALTVAQNALSSKVIAVSLEILARKRRATGFLIDATSSLYAARRKAAGVLTLIQGLPIVALRTAEDLIALKNGVISLLEHIGAKLRLSSFPVERVLSLIDSMGSDVNRSIGRVLSTQGGVLETPFQTFVALFESCCELFEAWSNGFNHCRKVARDAARKKGDVMPPRGRSPLSDLCKHLTEIYELRSDHEALRSVLIHLSPQVDHTRRVEKADSAFSALAKKCASLNHFELTSSDQVTWAEAGSSYRAEIAKIEDTIAVEYCETARIAKSLGALARDAHPFESVLEKQFMASAIAEAIPIVLDLANAELKPLEERELHIRGRVVNGVFDEIPPICVVLSECRLLHSRLISLTKALEHVVGKTHLEIIPDLRDFSTNIQQLLQKVEQVPRFTEWLKNVDLHSHSSTLFTLERKSDIVRIVPSLDTKVAWLFRVVRLVRGFRDQDLSEVLTPKIIEFSRTSKALFPAYSQICEAVNCFHRVDSSLQRLDQAILHRLLPFIEPLVLDARSNLEEGFRFRWEDGAARLSPYCSKLLQSCYNLECVFKILLENDIAIQSAMDQIRLLRPRFQGGQLCHETKMQFEQISARIGVGRKSIFEVSDSSLADQYFMHHCVHKLSNALFSVSSNFTEELMRALKKDGISSVRVLLDVACSDKTDLTLVCSPSVLHIEQELHAVLGNAYACLVNLMNTALGQVHEVPNACFETCCGLLASFLKDMFCTTSRATQMTPLLLIHQVTEGIVLRAQEWSKYISIINVGFEVQPSSLSDGPKALEKIAHVYEEVRLLRETDSLSTNKFFSSLQLSAKLESTLQRRLELISDEFSSKAASCSQDLYKKISEGRVLVNDTSDGDGAEVLVALQAVKEDVFPLCASTLQALSELEFKFEDLASRLQDSAFSRAQSTETWILCDSLEAHYRSLVDLYEQRNSTVLLNRDVWKAKYESNRSQYQLKLAGLFADFQNMRKTEVDRECFLEAEVLMQDLEHQLKSLDGEGLNLQRIERALDIPEGFERNGPRDILVEVERVKQGLSRVASVEGNLRKLGCTCFANLDPTHILQELEIYSNEVDAIVRLTGAKKEASLLKEDISAYVKSLSLLKGLRSVKLSPPRERDVLQRIFKDIPVKNGIGSIPLDQFWKANLPSHEAYIRKVLESAGGEASVAEFLDGIERTWTARKVQFSAQDEAFVLRNIPDLVDELEEVLQALAVMSDSQYARLFEAEKTLWERRLAKCYEELELLADVQARWLHLRSLFGTRDCSGMAGLRSEMKEEFALFSNVHARYCSSASRMKSAPGILEGLEDSETGLQGMSDELQGIVRGLSRFLEKQRCHFPRFFFLSDTDLLQVLSVTPSTVEGLLPHVGKLFPGLSSLEYEKETSTAIVSKGVSKEGEVLLFAQHVVFAGQSSVTLFLRQIQECIEQTLKFSLPKAVHLNRQIYCGVHTDMREFFKSYLELPAQIGLLAIRACFTSEVEEAFLRTNKTGIFEKFKDLRNSVEETLQGILSIDDSELANVHLGMRSGLLRSQFIKEVVYQRDRINLFLRHRVTKPSSYLWSHELRVYFDSVSTESHHPHVDIRCGAASFTYGWEYLGVGDTLVHTDLTSRCYLVLCESLRRGFGGSPFGPAGTGKTETVKALGRNLGRFVAVFNCDESFDAISVGRILAGACRLGCWVCFDEFNRLSSSILSSTSGQLATLQDAIRRSSSQIPNFCGGDIPISISSGVGVFVTMNPTYSGRRDLPGNLKSLFRPCGMSKPDSVSITEVLLLSQGFTKSETLSRKLVSFFNALQEILSAQSHYDFGLRALKSTALACGMLLSSGFGIDTGPVERMEENVVVRGVAEILKPKLAASDVMEYENTLRLVFNEATCLSPRMPSELESILEAVLKERQVVRNEILSEKMRQLYWLLKHQSGIMLVGPAGCGKSSVWRTLLDVMRRCVETKCSETGCEQQQSSRSSVTVLDPKLLDSKRLYGHLDPLSREWTDGIFTRALRNLATNYGKLGDAPAPLHWIIFDGDVDPDWVESLNSLLDDNRILTLPNGEQIPLVSNARILFETEDLNHANPSTVSRCGMVCFGELDITMESLNASIQAVIDEVCRDCGKLECLGEVASAIVKLAKEVHGSGSLSMNVPISSLLSSFITLFQSSLRCFADPSRMATFSESYLAAKPAKYVTMSEKIVLRVALHTTIRALGAGLSHADRRKLTKEFLNELDTCPGVQDAIAGLVVPADLASAELTADGHFVDYRDLIPTSTNMVDEASIGSPDVVIPTQTTLRLESLLRDALDLLGGRWTQVTPLILCGPPGCGKSMILSTALRHIPNISLATLSFSSETTPENVLAALKAHMVLSRRSNGTFLLHPKSAGCRVVLFVDEVNLEKPDIYGTQKSAYLIRSIADHSGFWDGTPLHWVSVEGLQIVGACNPEKDAGRHKLPNRLLRHCNVIRVEQPSKEDLKVIYGVFVRSLLNLIDPRLCQKEVSLTSAMIEFYSTNSENFCPEDSGPLKPHYIYSPRELTRWIRGMTYLLLRTENRLSVASDPVQLESASDLVWTEVGRAFCYEARRLFCDRLSTCEERAFVESVLADVARSHLCLSSDAIADSLFTSWMQAEGGSGSRQRDFNLVRNPQDFRILIYEKLRIFAEEEGLGGSWMSGSGAVELGESNAMIDQFAVTDDVLTHLTRIDRILRQPLGHAVLMGSPGTGKKTLARFTAWMSGMDVYQIRSHSAYTELDFARDLRSILCQAGVKQRSVVIIFDESHAMESSFLEMMNSLLACGEVPGLFAGDDQTQLLDEMRLQSSANAAAGSTDPMLYQEFVRRVRNNLHIVFTMSAICSPTNVLQQMEKHGISAKDLGKRSPALYNRCTINWIGDWSFTTLEAVAELKIEVSLGSEKDQIIRSAVKMHEAAKQKFERISSPAIVSPRHFLEFIEQLNRIALEKGREIQIGVKRLTEGLGRLKNAGAAVDKLKDELTEKSVRLQQKELNANEMLGKMVEEQRLAEKSKVEAEQLAVAATEASVAVQEREDEVSEQLSAALPKVEAAREAVGSIRKEYLEELRAMPNPPSAVRVALEGVLMVLDASNRKPDAKYTWANIRSRMRGSEFITAVVNFDSASVPKGLRHRIEGKIFQNPDFDVKKIAYASRVAGPLAEWTLAVFEYLGVEESVEPLQLEVEELHREQEELQERQEEALKEVDEFQARIDECKREYAKLVSEAERVRQEIEESQSNVSRAEKMLDSLAEEWDRWIKDLRCLNAAATSVWGNSVFSAAFVSYAGALDYIGRSSLRKEWKDILESEGIPFERDCNIAEFLTSAQERGFWSTRGLSTDPTSLENYAILKRSARYPLIIDPSRRGSDLLTRIFANNERGGMQDETESASDFRFSQSSFGSSGKKGYMRALESAMRFGTTIILEETEKFDQAVTPLLGQESSYGDAVKYAESVNPAGTSKTAGNQRKSICQRVVRLGDRDVFLSPSFRLYLAAVNLFDVPRTAVSRSNIVSFELSSAALKSACISIAMNVLSPELEEKRKQTMAAKVVFQEKKRSLEEKVLATVNRVDDLGAELLRGSLLDDLTRLKEEVREIGERQEIERVAVLEVKRCEAKFEPLGDTAVEVYSVIRNLVLINLLYIFNTTGFLKTFESSIRRSSEAFKSMSDYDEVSESQKNLLKCAFVDFAASLFPNDRLPYTAALSLVSLISIPPCHNSEYSSDDVAALRDSWKKVTNLPSSKGVRVAQERGLSILPLSLRTHLEHESNSPPSTVRRSRFAASLNVLERYIREPQKVLEAMDELACTLPGNISLVRGMNFGADAVLQEEFTAFAGGKFGKKSPHVPLLLCARGASSDPSALASELANRLDISIISLAMGSNVSTGALDNAFSLAKRAGEGGKKVMVLLKNIHLATESSIARLHVEVAKRQKNIPFLLVVAGEVARNSALPLPQGTVLHFRILSFEGSPSFRGNFTSAMSKISSIRLQSTTGDPELLSNFDRVHVIISWLHTCILERSIHSPIGFSRPYEFSDGDLTAAWDAVTFMTAAEVKSEYGFGCVAHLLKTSVYGCRLESDADQEILNGLVEEFCSIERLTSEADGTMSISDGYGSHLRIPYEPSERTNFASMLPLEAPPGWSRMPADTNALKQIREGRNAVKKVLTLTEEPFREASGGDTETVHNAPSRNGVSEKLLIDLATRMPEVPSSLPFAYSESPLGRFWETERTILEEISTTVREDADFLSGKLTQTKTNSRAAKLRRELSELSFSEDPTPPSSWKYLCSHFGDNLTLSSFFSHLGESVLALPREGSSNHIDISAAMRPKSLMAALKLEEASRRHVSPYVLHPVITISSDDNLGLRSVSGLRLSGAMWDTNENFFALSDDPEGVNNKFMVDWLVLGEDDKISPETGYVSLPLYGPPVRRELLGTFLVPVAKVSSMRHWRLRGASFSVAR